MSQPAFDHREESLDDIVDSILGSYRELGGINHIEGANLPSRQSVERIIGELESLIFPVSRLRRPSPWKACVIRSEKRS